MNNNINVPVMNNQNQKLKESNNESKTTSEDITSKHRRSIY